MPTMKPSPMSEPEQVSEGPHWMSPARRQLKQALTPVDANLETLASDPSKIGLLAQQQPGALPRLLQQAKQQNPALAAMIKDALVEQYRRSAGGYGADASKIFRSSLALDGVDADVVTKEVEELVIARDNAIAPGMDAEQKVITRAAQDREYGKLYASYFDDPNGAANLLLQHSKSDPSSLGKRMTDLRGIMRDPAQIEAFVNAVMKLKGEGSADVQVLTLRELHAVVEDDLRLVKESDSKAPGMRTSWHERVERLAPLLARLTSKPEVASELMVEGHANRQNPEGRPRLEPMMEDLLRFSYSDDVKMEVQNTIMQGGADMLKRSLAATESGERNQWGRTSGEFLGSAARAQAKVGQDKGTVARLAEDLGTVGKYMKMAPSAVPTPASVPVSTAGTALSTMSTLLGFIPQRRFDPTYTGGSVDDLLEQVYSETNPRPHGPSDSDGAKNWNTQYLEWQGVPAQWFMNAKDADDGE